MTLPLPCSTLVVTGTGTDVGKTFVSCQLIHHLRARGLSVQGLKPMETGYRPEVSDASALAVASGHPTVVPFFTALDPISPHRAARTRGLTLTSPAVAEWVRGRTQQGAALVETAGGLFSPLSQSETMLDLVRALEPCFFLLVAPDRLGTLHDVVSTVCAAESRHRAPDAILLNPLAPNALENAAELAYLRVAPPVFNLADASDFAALCDQIHRAIVGGVHS